MNWKFAMSVLGAALIIRLIGFVNNIWLLLGFVAFVWLWGYLVFKMPQQKKIINYAMGIFLAVALVSTIGLNLYNAHVKPYTTMSQAATERAKIAADLEAAMRINPQMLKSRMTIMDTIQWLQDKIGEQNQTEMDGVKRSLLAKEINPEDAWKIIFKIIGEENDNRKKANDAVSRLSSVSLAVPQSTGKSSGSIAKGLLLIGVILLTIGFIPKIPGKGFAGGLGILLLIAAIFLWAFPGIAPGSSAIAGQITGELKPSTRGKTEAKIKQKDLITVTLSSKEWSDPPVYLKACTVYEIVGPPGSVYRLLADPEKKEYPVGVRKFKDEESKKGIPTDERFQHGIQYKGLPGQDGQTVYIRRVPPGTPPNIDEESS